MASSHGNIFVLLLLCTGCQSTSCPAPEDLNPCSCSIIDSKPQVTCNGLKSTEDLVKALETLKRHPVTSFLLYNSSLQNLPPDVFHQTDILHLTINNTNLDSLRNGNQPLFSGLEDTLRQLVIYQCFHSSIHSRLSINHLSALSVLVMQRNTIANIGNDWFDRGPYGIEELIVSNTGGTKLGSQAFFSLHNLLELRLEDMKLTKIERKMFPIPAKRLKILSVSHNRIGALPEDVFTKMPKLEDIYLDNNAIKTMPEITWKPVWKQLDVIFLAGNPLVCDSDLKWICKHDRKERTLYGNCEEPIRLRHRPLDKLSVVDLG